MKAASTISERYLIDIPDVLRLRLQDDSIWFDVQQNNNTWVSCNLPSRFIEHDQLEHIRAVCKNGTISLTRADGMRAEVSFSGLPLQITRNVYIGVRAASGDKFFPGKLDEIRIQAE